MLLPSVKWKWFIDSTNLALMVELDSGLFFQTAYRSEHLHTLPDNQYFDIEQSNYFTQIAEALHESEVPFDQSAQMQIALNGTAALCFHRPVINKSWLYEKQNACIYVDTPELAWFKVNTEFYLALTLIKEGDSVLCLNLSERFITSDNKIHEQFCVIRILSDRLIGLDSLIDDDVDASQQAKNL